MVRGIGSATDTLTAGLKTGPEGKAYGLDMTEAMLDKRRANPDPWAVSPPYMLHPLMLKFCTAGYFPHVTCTYAFPPL